MSVPKISSHRKKASMVSGVKLVVGMIKKIKASEFKEKNSKRILSQGEDENNYAIWGRMIVKWRK